MSRRVLLAILVLVGMLGAPFPVLAARVQEAELPADLAAMPVLPRHLDEPGYQFARGGYLTVREAQYLIEQGHDVEPDAVTEALEAGSWRQGYTQTLVLLEDRADRTSTPLAAIETTIHAFADDEGAELVLAMMAGAPPGSAESLDPVIDGVATYRIVTPQDDRLVTVIRYDRFVFEIVSVDASRAPDMAEHTERIRLTLDRAELVTDGSAYGLSQRTVLLEDSRLIPLAIESEAPLVYTFYRLIDDVVVPVAGELRAPTMEELPEGAGQIVVSRQTAELASQSWLTTGVVVLDFGSTASANDFASSDVFLDPLDIFAADEQDDLATSLAGGVRIESISGEARIGGRYSGYRVTVRDETKVAQLTVWVMGNTRLDQRRVELWALAQRECLTGGRCESVLLTGLLATPDPATPVTSGVADGVYQSPVAAWQVTFDPDI